MGFVCFPSFMLLLITFVIAYPSGCYWFHSHLLLLWCFWGCSLWFLFSTFVLLRSFIIWTWELASYCEYDLDYLFQGPQSKEPRTLIFPHIGGLKEKRLCSRMISCYVWIINIPWWTMKLIVPSWGCGAR